MWSGFQDKKLNTCGEHELYHAKKQAEPENQAGLVTFPDPDQKQIFNIFFLKIKSGTMPNHHMKGQPATSTYVREKGGVKKDSNRETPCRYTVYVILKFYI